MQDNPIGEVVEGGFIRTRTGRLIPISAAAAKPTATPAPASAAGRSNAKALSIGFACAVFVFVIASILLSLRTGQSVNLETVIGDFGHVIREVRGPGL